MNDYINRADALEACHPVMPTDGVGTIGLTYEDIKNLPAADVVEVVRCKDCKYCCHDLNGMLVCNSNQRVPPFYTDHDFYCAHGERSADNG